MHYSLNDLGKQIAEEDLLLEGTLTIQVDISLERSHLCTRTEDGGLRLKVGQGWLVSLGLPSRGADSRNEHVFSDGEPQMICDLHYLGGEERDIRLDDAVNALGIDSDAKIWTVKKAP